MLTKISTTVIALLCSLQAVGVAARPHAITTPLTTFITVGDSTVATGGGWGDGFKNSTLNAKYAVSINMGKSGATTASYIGSGEWATVLSQVKANKAKRNVYVTIQFGHNDMKIANFTEKYRANLVRMVGDVKAAGGQPVIVSSLSRRNYLPNSNVIDDTLKPWRNIAIDVAQTTNSLSIDLWKTSLDYCELIGETSAWKLNLNSKDHTHLDHDGSLVFGTMVAGLLQKVLPASQSEIWSLNQTMLTQEDQGIPSF